MNNYVSRRHQILVALSLLLAEFAIQTRLAAVELSTGPLLIQGASINSDQIVFGCGGKLWSVSAAGGTAKQLTSSSGNDQLPVLSPDGACVVFLRRSERVMDVYLRVLASGEERRLTYHPARDFPVGFSPSGTAMLFQSNRDGNERLYTLALAETFPTPVPLPTAYVGSLSPDGRRIAYLPRSHNYQFSEFRHYHGGASSPMWIADLETGAIEQVTDERANAHDPIWIEGRIYFSWDCDGTFNLYVYDLLTKEIRKLTNFDRFGVRSAASDGRSVVLVVDGELHVFDVASESVRTLEVQIPLDRAATRARTVNALQWIQSYSLDRAGAQAVVCGRGDVFLVDVASGNARNITRSSGVAEREARVSPDGRFLAYFADSTGEYSLRIRDTSVKQTEMDIPIEAQPSFYRELTWSPDSKRVAFSDQHVGVWLADVETREVKKIDRSPSSAQDVFQFSWHPGARYLAYTRYDENRLPSVLIYDIRTSQSHPVTSGDVHATCPVFDKSGQHLYFLSSANAPTADFGWNVLNGVFSAPLVVRRLNIVVLHNGHPAPLMGRQPNLAVNWKEIEDEREIDFDSIHERIVSTGVDALAFTQVAAGPPGNVYALVDEWPIAPGSASGPTRALYRLNLRAPSELKKIVPLLESFAVSHDGTTLLYRIGSDWILLEPQGSKSKPRRLSLAALPAPLDPAREWKQLFRESWRLMRDIFYDPQHHGHNWSDLEQHYAAFLHNVTSREELNVLMRRMLGHVGVSHLNVSGGDVLASLNEAEAVGLLGADMEISDGLYRFKHVLASAHFDGTEPSTRAPLAQPGATVADGEYLLAIDDQSIDANNNLYAAMRGKASRPIRLTVSTVPDRSNARTITVIPVADETTLRIAEMGERNRQKVEQLSDGKLGYFHVASYTPSGLQAFFRGYFANRSKAGLIIDQRYNGGGITPDYFLELLRRRPLYYYVFRNGDDLGVPVNARKGGPTVLLINEGNVSAAETFALMFHLGKVGCLVGKRTYGGGIGPYGFTPSLIDGGRIQIPNRGAFDPSGTWGIENEGVRPDVDVDVLPQDWRAGCDPQLEAAIRVGLEELKAEAPVAPRRPPFPVHP